MRISDWSSDVGSSDLRASSSASTTQNACRSGLRPRRPAPDLPRRHCESSAGSRAVGDVAPTYGVEPECGPRPEHYAPRRPATQTPRTRSEEHTSELQVTNAHIVCRLLLEKKKKNK